MKRDSRSIYSKVTFTIFFIIVLLLSFKLASSFLVAILTGGIIAYALRPLQKKRLFLKLKPTHAAFIIVIGIAIIVVFPLVLSILSLTHQAVELENYLPTKENLTLKPLVEYIDKLPLINRLSIDSTQIENQIKIWITQLGSETKSAALNMAQKIPLIGLQLLITLISCFVFLSEGDQFISWISSKIPLKDEIKKSLKRSFSSSSKSAVWSSLSAAGFQGLAILFSFLIFDVPGAFLAGGATFIFNFIPIIGAAPFWIIGGIYLYWKGMIVKLIMWGVLAIVASLLESVVRILVLKGARGLHPLVGMIAVFGGLQVFGFFGVLIGPIIVALLISMCEVLPQMWQDLI